METANTGNEDPLSHKRWHALYDGNNPFALPRAIYGGLRQETAQPAIIPAPLKYVWVYAAQQALDEKHANEDCECVLTLDDWLAILDESAALGAEYVIISLCAPLESHPDTLAMIEWAGSSLGMQVGLHFFGIPATDDALRQLAALGVKNLHVFVDQAHADSLTAIQAFGLHGHLAEGRVHDHVIHTCDWPKEMTCVGANGGMYTCGLVLGHEAYSLGNFFDRRLDETLTDETLPHVIPQGLPKDKHYCNGCPPLMIERMRAAV